MVSSTDPVKNFGLKYWNLHFAHFRVYSFLESPIGKMESLFLGHLRETIFSLHPRESHIEAFVDTTAAAMCNFLIYLVNYTDTCS